VVQACYASKIDRGKPERLESSQYRPFNFSWHLGGQTGKTKHFLAKSVWYSPQFWGWAQGPGVLWAKNLPRHFREVENHPSVVYLTIRGHLGY